MSDPTPRRIPAPGRARKRAIREHAARAGLAYSEAARQLESVGLRPGETLSRYGRTIYPIGFDPHRQLLVERRERRSFEERVSDTRRAAALPHGRAQHLVERFPPSRGRTGSGVGSLYHGEGREELLAMLYIVIVVESPGLLPEVGTSPGSRNSARTPRSTRPAPKSTARPAACSTRIHWPSWSSIQKALTVAEHIVDGQVRSQEAIRQTALLSTMMTPRLGYAGEPYSYRGCPSPAPGRSSTRCSSSPTTDTRRAPGYACSRSRTTRGRPRSSVPGGFVRPAGGLSPVARRGNVAAVGPPRRPDCPGRPGNHSALSRGPAG